MINKDASISLFKEYVASLIGLYKNNGAVSCVGINFHSIGPLYNARTLWLPWVYSDTELDAIISWAIMYSNCNTFFVNKLKIDITCS